MYLRGFAGRGCFWLLIWFWLNFLRVKCFYLQPCSVRLLYDIITNCVSNYFLRCANVALETVNKIFYLLDNVPFPKNKQWFKSRLEGFAVFKSTHKRHAARILNIHQHLLNAFFFQVRCKIEISYSSAL